MQMKDPATAPYKVWRHDKTAHVVEDRATKIIGCAVFEASRNLTDGVVRSVDTPSVVLVRPGSDTLTLSVTDPDLRFYDGPDRSKPEASPFGVPWRASQGQGSWITVEVEGRWISPTKGMRATPNLQRGARDTWTTSILVHCEDGLPTELQLNRF